MNIYGLRGEGTWDYLAFDTPGHRLFIARQNRVMVVNPDSGKLLGEIPGIRGAHGVAFSYATNQGFATEGTGASVTRFDLKTLQVLGRIPAATDADAIFYDSTSKHIFTMNGDAGGHQPASVDAVIPESGSPRPADSSHG